MPHNCASKAKEISDQFDFVVFGGEYGLFNGALAIVDVIVTGGNCTLEYIKSEVKDFGVDVVTEMIKAGINPTSEPIYSGVKIFQNWEQPLPGVKIPLPNKFVPYIAARKKPVASPTAAGSFMVPSVQVGTALEESNGYFEFGMGVWSGASPELFIIKKRETDSKMTEVHILSGESNFSQFILQTATALPETDWNWKFLITDTNSIKPDLMAINRRGTSAPYMTEVHILSGESNYQKFVLQVKTKLEQTDDTWDFGVAGWSGNKPDLFAIKKSGTTNKKTEVHILSGDSNYQDFVFQKETALPETYDNFQILIGRRDGQKADLFAVKKSDTDSKMTEVHILSGESDFSKYILQTATALPPTDGSFDFQLINWDGGDPDLVAIKKQATGTRSTEVHIFKG